MASPMLLLSVMLLGASGAQVKLAVMDLQPLQPFDDHSVPCGNISKPMCFGGFPNVNAVMRAETAGADGTIKLGALVALSRLMSTHPDWIYVNYRLYQQAGYDAILMHQADITVSPRFSDAVRHIDNGSLPLVNTNMNSDPYNMRAFLKYSYLKHFKDLGIKMAVLACYPSMYWHSTLSIETVIKYTLTLREALAVTHVVMILVEKALESDVDAYTASGLFDVILFRKDIFSNKSPPSHVRRVGNTWQAQVRGVYPRVDVVGMDINSATGIANVTLKSVDTGMGFPETVYKDAMHVADTKTMQEEVDKAATADSIIAYSTAAMPHAFYRHEDGTIEAACRYEECHLGTLSVEAMAVGGRKTDITFLNGGNMFEGWGKGPVRFSHLAKAQPYQDTLCYLNMTAAGLWKALEHSVAGVGTDGRFNASAKLTEQFLQVTGMRYFYNPLLPPGGRITRMEVKERGEWVPINRRREYSITTTNWVCTGGDGHNFAVSSGKAEITQIDQWSLTASRLRELSPYTPVLRGVIGIEKAPSLRLAKSAEDCGEHARYLEFWEDCEPCPEGYYHPNPGPEPCILRAVPSSDDITIVVVIPILVCLLLTVVAALLRHLKQRAEHLRLHANAPTQGAVTFVFTDIVSSSDIWEKYPKEMDEALSLHHDVIRRAIALYEGYEVKTIGDSFMVAFKDPMAAVQFACKVQVDLANPPRPWPCRILEHPSCAVEAGFPGGLRVRIGAHMGYCAVKRTRQGGYDYEGVPVNVTSRVSDSGNGGQIVITESVYESVEGQLDLVDVEVKYLGTYAFRGVSDPVGCVQIIPEELAVRDFKALRNAQLVETNASQSVPTAKHTVVEMETTSLRSFSTADEDTSKADRISAMQTLRKSLSVRGCEGVPVQYIVHLLSRCLENNLITERRLLTLLLMLTNSPAPPLGGAAIAHRKYTVRASEPALSDNNTPLVRWVDFTKLCRSLSTPCLIHMAAAVDDLNLSEAAMSQRHSHSPRESVKEDIELGDV